MVVNGTDVTVNGIDNISEQEILAYMNLIHQENRNDEIETLEISAALVTMHPMVLLLSLRLAAAQILISVLM